VNDYGEYAASAEYLHLLSAPMWTALRPRLTAALRGVAPDAGPVLELGPGTGLGTDVLLDAVDNDLVLVEPSAGLRAVLLARLGDRGATDRVSVLPCRAGDAPLPDRLAAAVGLHMVGHLAPPDRAALWLDLARRLAPGAPLVLNLQPPPAAVEVPVTPWFGPTLGGLAYEGRGRAEPTGPDSVRWRMDYRTRRGETVLATAVAEYDWWIVTAEVLADELAAAGFTAAVDDDLVVAIAPRPQARP
jgi:methyltransferase family protein